MFVQPVAVLMFVRSQFTMIMGKIILNEFDVGIVVQEQSIVELLAVIIPEMQRVRDSAIDLCVSSIITLSSMVRQLARVVGDVSNSVLLILTLQK